MAHLKAFIEFAPPDSHLFLLITIDDYRHECYPKQSDQGEGEAHLNVKSGYGLVLTLQTPKKILQTPRRHQVQIVSP